MCHIVAGIATRDPGAHRFRTLRFERSDIEGNGVRCAPFNAETRTRPTPGFRDFLRGSATIPVAPTLTIPYVTGERSRAFQHS